MASILVVRDGKGNEIPIRVVGAPKIPAIHSDTHRVGGIDQIRAEDIGAAREKHDHGGYCRVDVKKAVINGAAAEVGFSFADEVMFAHIAVPNAGFVGSVLPDKGQLVTPYGFSVEIPTSENAITIPADTISNIGASEGDEVVAVAFLKCRSDCRFLVGGKTYSFKEYMTWQEFIDSEYNPDYFDQEMGRTYKSFIASNGRVAVYFGDGGYSIFSIIHDSGDYGQEGCMLYDMPRPNAEYMILD